MVDLRLGARLPCSLAEYEALGHYILRTFPVAERAGDEALRSYVIDVAGEVFGPLERCVARWLRRPRFGARADRRRRNARIGRRGKRQRRMGGRRRHRGSGPRRAR